MDIYNYLTLLLLLKQGYISALRYCPEAVASVEVVTVCPTSKKERNIAANRKNCGKLATSQNCTSFENFVYHCTINSYRNATLEVCAPKRTILGHCAEFNIVGGVIQDQHSAKCNKTFPKCDKYYISSDAYKYADCYKLAQPARFLQTDTTTEKNRIQTVNDHTEFFFILPTVGMAVILAMVVVVAFVMRRKRNIANSDSKKTKKDQRLTKFEKEQLQMLLLNGNFTLHGDISDYFPDVMKNDTTRFKIEIKELFGTDSRSDTISSKQSSISVYYDASDNLPDVLNTTGKNTSTSSKKRNTSAAIDKEAS